MADAKTKLLGVIGDPIEHSLSPVMHNFILERLGLNFCYHAFHVKQEDLPRALNSFQILNFRGINVTLPHKEKIIQYLDEIQEEAALLEAVNTVLFKKEKIIGYNTDVVGFMKSVENLGINLKEKKAILIGAGGSAKAVALGLQKLGCKEIIIYNRTLKNAQVMAAFLKEKSGQNIFSALDLKDSQIYQDVRDGAILVNATNVGMGKDKTKTPLPDDLKMNSDMLVFDLIYNPLETALLKMAREQGVRTQNGLEMLIYQGIASLEIWLGRKIEISSFLNDLKNKIIGALAKDG